jgi:hypothetical protein
MAALKGNTSEAEQLNCSRRETRCPEQHWVGPICRLQRLCACAVSTDSRRLGRDTALFFAARGGHSATIAALVFAGADRDVSNNSGYGKRRGSAWVQSSHAFGLGQAHCGEARRRGRHVGRVRGGSAQGPSSAAIDWSGRRAVPARGRPRLAAAGGSRTAGAHACLRIPCRHSNPVACTGRRGRAWARSTQQRACCAWSACAAVRATD